MIKGNVRFWKGVMVLNYQQTMSQNDCGNCKPENTVLPVMAYVPWQTLQSVYEPEQGWHQGTIFPELNKPFAGGCKRG